MTNDIRTTVVLRRDTVVTLRQMAFDHATLHGGHVNVSAIVQGMLDDALNQRQQNGSTEKAHRHRGRSGA